MSKLQLKFNYFNYNFIYSFINALYIVFYKINLAIWPKKPLKLLLLTEASVITESSVKTEDREFSAEGFRPKLLPKITPEASAEVNFVLTLPGS